MINRKEGKTLKIFTDYLLVLALIFISLLWLFPGIYDVKCNRVFDSNTCFSDSIYYNKMGLLGQCYIKNYHVKGIPNETVNLKLDIYVAENDQNKINISDEEISLIIENVNKIWNAYGINFNINRLERFIVNNNLVHGENIKELANYVGKGHLYKDEDKNIDVILIPEFKTRLWAFDLGNLLGLEGVYLDSFPPDNRTISLIMVGTKDVKNETWVIAHELGHLLGSYDYPHYSGQFNLMTESGCIKERYHPIILNQNQVDSAIRTAKTFIEAS